MWWGNLGKMEGEIFLVEVSEKNTKLNELFWELSKTFWMNIVGKVEYRMERGRMVKKVKSIVGKIDACKFFGTKNEIYLNLYSYSLLERSSCKHFSEYSAYVKIK